MTRPTRQFVPWKFGQLHVRIWQSSSSSRPPIICLPPSPYSGVAYSTLAPLLAGDRTVVALDYPGYGCSDPVDFAVSIETYADAAAAVATALFADQKVCLLGFHTGTLVAVETSLKAPELVHSLILIDVPYFETKERKHMLEKMGKPKVLSPDLSMLSEAWEFGISNRLDVMELERAYELFVDQISSGEREPEAFRAAFNYPCNEKFAAVDCVVTCIATKAGLYEQTVSAAHAISGCRLIELLHVNVAVLDSGAHSVVAAIE